MEPPSIKLNTSPYWTGDALTLARRFSHDVRSPLGAISTSAELLSELVSGSNDNLVSLIRGIEHSASQGLDLVGRVVSILRSTYGDQDPWEELNLGIVIDSAVVANERRRKDVGATITKPNEWPVQVTVQNWQCQIWTQLISNAICHGGKSIELGWEDAGQTTRFWVRDDGPGLPETAASMPFPAFEALHSIHHIRGLGLSIVRRLIECLGGTPHYSRLPDGRTEFAFTVPKAPPSVRAQSQSDASTKDRVETQAALGLLDESTEEEFDIITQMVRRVLDVPVTLLSIVTDDRQFFKSSSTTPGTTLPVRETPLTHSFCRHVVERDAPLRVADALQHPLVSDNPAIQSLGVRSYLGVPIHATSGLPLGSLCAISNEARDWSADDLDVLHQSAQLIQNELRLRDKRQRLFRSERARSESDDRFITLANNITQFAWMADAKGDIFWYNQRWFDYTGTTLEEMRGWGWMDVHHPDHVNRVVKKVRHCFETGTDWEDTFPLRGADGNYRWFLSRALPIRDDSGAVVRWFGTNTDVTHQREVEEALRKASQAKDDFIAVLSHELRTPLSPVLLIASAAAGRTDLPPDVQEDFDVIRRSIEMEARLIDDLLDMTRILRGKLPLVVTTVSVNALIDESVELLLSEASTKQLKVETDFDSQRMHLQGDEVRLRQVLWNILRNAVKFTPMGGHVRLATKAVGDHVQIIVEDSGIGISDAELQRIFQPFAQGDHSSTSEGEQQFGGLGLGLAIAKMLVELHGGTIKARSGGRGAGTIVTLDLPLSKSTPSAVRAEQLQAAEEMGDHGKIRPLRILLVEDHDATRETLALLLRRRGHTIIQAASVASALQEASQDEFDLLMSDIGLPDGRGDELMTKLRSSGFTKPAVALSGYGMEVDVLRSRQAGFSLHLTKPVSIQELDRALARIFR